MPETPRYRYRTDAPDVPWRAVNEAYVESTGLIPPRVEHVLILPVLPYTRVQRALHRLGVCRWHRHQPLKIMLDGLSRGSGR